MITHKTRSAIRTYSALAGTAIIAATTGALGVYIAGSDIPESPDGQYHVAMRADGVLGGCNTGEMSGWAGHLNVQTGADA